MQSGCGMTVDQINRIVEPVMNMPTLRVERKDKGEWYRVPFRSSADNPWVNEESAHAQFVLRVAAYGLFAVTETVFATGRKTKVFTYRLHHFEGG